MNDGRGAFFLFFPQVFVPPTIKTSTEQKVNGVNMKVEGSVGRWTRVAGARNSSIREGAVGGNLLSPFAYFCI